MKPYSRSTAVDSTVTTEMGLKWLIASEGHELAAVPEMSVPRPPKAFSHQDQFELDSPFKQRTADGTICVLIPDLAPQIRKTSGNAAQERSSQDLDFEREAFQHLKATLAEVGQGASASEPVVKQAEGFSFLPLAMTLKAPVIPLGADPHSDLSEPPNEWRERGDGKSADRKATEESGKKTSKEQAVEKIARSIVERYPLGNPGLVVFAGPEANSLIDETCARVATSLSERTNGRALLIDADNKGQALTIASGVAGQPGVSDVVAGGVDWKSTVFGGSATGLDFIGAGSRQDLGEHAKPLLRQLVVGLKREYQFICVSAGASSELSSQCWNDVGDGTYLLVSLKNSNQSLAKAAVSELRVSGGRLLGCVVTDVD